MACLSNILFVNSACFLDILIMILLLAIINNYTCTYTHMGITCPPLNNTCLSKFKGKELALGKLRMNVQLTIWKSHQVLPKNILQTVKSALHFFPSYWHLSSPANKTKPFFHSLGSALPHHVFCPAARNVVFSLLPIISSANKFFFIASSRYFTLM